MRRYRTISVVVIGILAAGVAVACTLNPQPLPPADFANAQDSDAAAGEGGSLENPNPPAADAAGGNQDGGRDSDGSVEASDDAGDAATDADGG
jgi:hypothetical protein